MLKRLKYIIYFVSQFIIDEQKMYALTNYSSKCNQKYSDHNSIITKFSLTFHGLKPERRHIYNFKNEEGFLKFKSLTAANGRFSNIFNNKNGLSFAKQIKIWQKRLKIAIKSCFLKVVSVL